MVESALCIVRHLAAFLASLQMPVAPPLCLKVSTEMSSDRCSWQGWVGGSLLVENYELDIDLVLHDSNESNLSWAEFGRLIF